MMQNVLGKVLGIVKKHKIISFIAVLAVGVGIYFIFQGGSSVQAQYVLAVVEKGTIITSISGTGQVSSLQQVDVKPEVSGKITYVNVKTGQKVYKGQALAYINASDAQRSVRDAEINLESAQIALTKLKNNQENTQETTTDDLADSYADAYNEVADAFLDLPDQTDLARGILHNDDGISSVCDDNICAYNNLADIDFKDEFSDLVDRAESDYEIAKNAYDPNFQSYKSLRIDASQEQIVSILEATNNTAVLLAQAIKSEKNMLDSLVGNMKDIAAKQSRTAQIPSQITNYQSEIGTTLSKLNSIISSLQSAENAIESAKRSIKDNQLTDPIDLKSQENTVAQREASLADAKEDLRKYTIVAPFIGTVAESDVRVGDSVSTGTTIVTMITQDSLAEVSLNETDVAQVNVGQKATITFDAIEDLSITGEVLEVDSLGTVNQGVVTYGIKVGFDTTDQRVKPGMTVSVSIITQVKQDVLMIPNSAVKSSNNGSYAEVPNGQEGNSFPASMSGSTGVYLNNGTNQKVIETGLSNDSYTEIINGLEEGDIIISRTITSSTTTQSTTSQGNSLLPSPGSGGGQFRTQTR